MQPIMEQHLRSYKDQQKGESRFEVVELVNDIDKQEKHGPQSQNSKNIGEKHNIGIFGDCKNGGD